MRFITTSLLLLMGLTAMAQTQLLGNYSNAGKRWTGYINMSTKGFTSLDSINSATAMIAGETAYDPVGRRYFCISTLGTHIIDSMGTVLASHATKLQNMQYAPSSGKLVGTIMMNNLLRYATMNLATGAITLLDTLSGTITQGQSAYDTYNDLYYVVTNAGLLQVDAVTGNTLDTLPNTLASIEYDPMTHAIIGIKQTGNNKLVFGSLDVLSHTTTIYDTLWGGGAFVFSESSFDPLTRLYYCISAGTDAVMINVNTGHITDTVKRQYYLAGIEINYRPAWEVMSTQPQSITTTVGSNIQFSVGTSAANPVYQWQVSTSTGFQNITNGGQYSGATSATLSVSNAGTANNKQQYRCLIATANKAWPSSIARLTVNPVLSVPTIKNTFTTFPNPATNTITIVAPSDAKGRPYTLYNQAGAVVLHGTLQGKSTTISISTLAAGMYNLNIQSEGKTVIRLVKQ